MNTEDFELFLKDRFLSNFKIPILSETKSYLYSESRSKKGLSYEMEWSLVFGDFELADLILTYQEQFQIYSNILEEQEFIWQFANRGLPSVKDDSIITKILDFDSFSSVNFYYVQTIFHFATIFKYSKQYKLKIPVDIFDDAFTQVDFFEVFHLLFEANCEIDFNHSKWNFQSNICNLNSEPCRLKVLSLFFVSSLEKFLDTKKSYQNFSLKPNFLKDLIYFSVLNGFHNINFNILDYVLKKNPQMVNFTNYQLEKPLDFAIKTKFTNMVTFLRNKGAVYSGEKQVPKRPYSQHIPLDLLNASQSGDINIIKNYIHQNYDFLTSQILLENAVRKGFSEMAFLLLNQNIHPFLLKNCLFSILKSPYQNQSWLDVLFVELVNKIPNLINWYDFNEKELFTPLDYAIIQGSKSRVKALKDKGALTLRDIRTISAYYYC